MLTQSEINEDIELMQWFYDSLPDSSSLKRILSGVPEYCKKNLSNGCLFPVIGYKEKFYEGYQVQKDAHSQARARQG